MHITAAQPKRKPPGINIVHEDREYNRKLQYYKGIPFRLIVRFSYAWNKAMRYTINDTNQNVWIPNKHLLPNGTLKDGENIDYVFRKSQKQLVKAGILQPIIGIKRRTVSNKIGVEVKNGT